MLKAILILSLVVAICAIPGGYVEVEVDDEHVLTAANHASEALSKQFASKYHHRLVKVLKAESQVVAGTNYRMDIVVGMTVCKKEDVDYDQTENCDFQAGVSTYKKCTVVVYRDLKGEHKLISTGCILADKNEIYGK